MGLDEGHALREWRSKLMHMTFPFLVSIDSRLLIVTIHRIPNPYSRSTLDLISSNYKQLLFFYLSLLSNDLYAELKLISVSFIAILNALRLEENEKREKEMLRQIIEEAEQYAAEFFRTHSVTLRTIRKPTERKREKLFLASQEKLNAEADKNYWKAIAELIPREVLPMGKRGKKDEKKKPSTNIIQGPKPGNPTDLSRMRQILTKLKHSPPPHMNPKPPPPPPPSEETKQDSKTRGGSSTFEAVAVVRE